MVKVAEKIKEFVTVKLKNLNFNEFQYISEHVGIVVIHGGVGAKTYTFSITSNPTNGDVVIDSVDEGLTPINVILSSGSHTMNLSV
jgi:hypothetical protein